MIVLLVGTNHSHQYVGYQNGAAEKFGIYLTMIIDTEAIDLLAEELNEESIKCFRASDSIARLIASERKLNHLFCDPNSIERRNIGIPTTEELRQKFSYGGNPTNKQNSNIETEARVYWPIRERFWLDRLMSRSSNRCLFVLGSNHVDSFSQLLSNQSIRNEIKSRKWEP